jgi:hypothetical protein
MSTAVGLTAPDDSASATGAGAAGAGVLLEEGLGDAEGVGTVFTAVVPAVTPDDVVGSAVSVGAISVAPAVAGAGAGTMGRR